MLLLEQPKRDYYRPSFKLEQVEEVKAGMVTWWIGINFNINISNVIKWVKNKVKLIDVAKPVCKNHFPIRRATKYVDLYKALEKKI